MPRLDDHFGDLRRTLQTKRRCGDCRRHAMFLQQAKHTGAARANAILIVAFVHVVADRHSYGDAKLINRLRLFVAVRNRHLCAFLDIDDERKGKRLAIWPVERIAHGSSTGTRMLRSNSMNTSPSDLNPRVRTWTMPCPSLLLDRRLSSTSVSA